MKILSTVEKGRARKLFKKKKSLFNQINRSGQCRKGSCMKKGDEKKINKNQISRGVIKLGAGARVPPARLWRCTRYRKHRKSRYLFLLIRSASRARAWDTRRGQGIRSLLFGEGLLLLLLWSAAEMRPRVLDTTAAAAAVDLQLKHRAAAFTTPESLWLQPLQLRHGVGLCADTRVDDALVILIGRWRFSLMELGVFFSSYSVFSISTILNHSFKALITFQ